LTALARDGTRRLDRPDDHVRREIELALERNVKIIPVLVGGAEIPGPQELPSSIAALSSRNALVISDVGFKEDIDRLVHAIEKIIGVSSVAETGEKDKGLGARFALGIGAIVAVLGLIGVILFLQRGDVKNQAQSPEGGQLANSSTSSSSPTTVNSTEQAKASSSPLPINLEESLGEEEGSSVYCKGFDVGKVEMLMEMRYGGAVTPECIIPNNVPFLNFVEAWCGGYTQGANQAARQINNEFLSDFEINRRYDLCVAKRKWENADPLGTPVPRPR
jgi:hypothetical protein